MHTRHGSVQGYNAQAVTTLEQVIVAAELTQQANDLQQLDPMLAATAATLGAAGIPQRPGRLLADSGYWTIANLTQIPDAPELLIPPARHGRQGKPRKDGKPTASRSDGLRAAMTAKLASDDGKACYASCNRPSSRSSARSKSSRARGGSCAGGLPPAMPSGSCCAAPTTCSSCGDTRADHHRPARRPPEPRPRIGRSHRDQRRPPGGRGHRDAPPYLYSGPSPIASLASALVGLQINDVRGDQLRALLYARTRRVLDHLDKLGATSMNTSGFPIVEVPLADPDDLPRAGRFLLDYGIYATLAFYPGVPRQEVGFRLQLTAAKTDQQVTQLLAVLDQLADTIPLRPRHP
jgi:hypothetical protein